MALRPIYCPAIHSFRLDLRIASQAAGGGPPGRAGRDRGQAQCHARALLLAPNEMRRWRRRLCTALLLLLLLLSLAGLPRHGPLLVAGSRAEAMAALLLALGGGTMMGIYPAFIKTPAVLAADVHPIVFQCYKSSVVFATGFVFMLPRYYSVANSSEPERQLYHFTYWALFSAAAWVPTGVSTIYAVPRIGMGMTTAVGSSTFSALSFVLFWLVFQDSPMKSYPLGIFGIHYCRAPTQPVVLLVDASKVGLGGCMAQYHDGSLCPVSYSSHRLTKSERLYPITELEGLAILHTVRCHRHFLINNPFTVRCLTDHKPLTWVQKVNTASGRLARWMMELANYDFRIEYIPGKVNDVADALSRLQLAEPASESDGIELTDETTTDYEPGT